MRNDSRTGGVICRPALSAATHTRLGGTPSPLRDPTVGPFNSLRNEPLAAILLRHLARRIRRRVACEQGECGMALYHVDGDKIAPVPSTTFAQKGIQERKHLQALLKSRPEVISPDTLIVAEEFGDWEDSRRRIDLLGIDKNANLVVIELKRTEDGGHMELQAVRYAAMISAMTFDMLVSRYDQYLKDNGDERDARESLVEFLNRDDSDDQTLGQDIWIVLASAEFSKELTTSVLWLNEQGLDIRCVRMRPYDNEGQVLLDVQTIIPTPEAEEYQIEIREKRQRERVARRITRDLRKYDVKIGDKLHSNQNKRNMMFSIVSAVFESGGSRPSAGDRGSALPSRVGIKAQGF